MARNKKNSTPVVALLGHMQRDLIVIQNGDNKNYLSKGFRFFVANIIARRYIRGPKKIK